MAMWPARFFSKRFWSGRFWPPEDTSTGPREIILTGAAGLVPAFTHPGSALARMTGAGAAASLSGTALVPGLQGAHLQPSFTVTGVYVPRAPRS